MDSVSLPEGADGDGTVHAVHLDEVLGVDLVWGSAECAEHDHRIRADLFVVLIGELRCGMLGSSGFGLCLD